MEIFPIERDPTRFSEKGSCTPTEISSIECDPAPFGQTGVAPQPKSDRSCDHFAFRVATMVVAAILSVVLTAMFLFLPFRVFAFQGLPRLVALSTAMYAWLRVVEQSGLLKDGGGP